METKPSIGMTLGWIFGGAFVLFGFVGIMASDFVPGVALVLMGLILLPPVGKFIESKWKFKLTATRKVIFLVAGFIIFGLSISSFDSPEKATQSAEQKSVREENNSAVEIKEGMPADNKVVQAEIAIPEQSVSEKKLYPVLKVVDGDTMAVEIDGKQEVLRLIGINTPETVDPRKPVECFGKEASNKAKEILTGKKVSIEADSTQGDLDKYNRPLRYVYLEDGTNFNKMMIEEGYAYEYTYNTPCKYQADFKEAERKAKEEKKGLWADDTCSGSLTKSTADTTPTIVIPQTEAKATSQDTGSSSGTCAGKRTCGQMVNCQEAYFYLNTCGVGSLDRDKDGIPCETICN
jgi:micrococcal nuclease